MIIKKFAGKTEEEALATARKELGSGVVIMNVKAVERKGLRAIFRARQVEVTVALEEESDTLGTVRREKASAPVKKEAVSHSMKKLSGDNTAQSEDFSYENALEPEDRISIEKKLDSLQSLLMTRFQQSEAERESTADRKVNSGSEGAAEAETQEEAQSEEITEQQRFLRLLYNTMLESEVDEKYANQIVNDVDMSGQANLPIDYILENIYQKMILKFGNPVSIRSQKRHFLFFLHCITAGDLCYGGRLAYPCRPHKNDDPGRTLRRYNALSPAEF